MVSRTSRYALRTLGYLAEHRSERILRRDIALATGIPANYLAKILNQSRKHGLVESQKGWGGGFSLRKQALGVPIAKVLEIIEGKRRGNECVFELRGCDACRPCPMHGHWERVRAEFEAMVRSLSIGDLGRRNSA
jgi:Rrf2 family transcriptional regulator, iron-sulfur cluster assembly transcription factor